MDGYISVVSRITAIIVLDLKAVILQGGKVEKCNVEGVEIKCATSSRAELWVKKIMEIAKLNDSVIFIDRSKGEYGRIAGGQSKDPFELGLYNRRIYIEKGAIVWDGEVASIIEALEYSPHNQRVLILQHSIVAI